MFGGSPNSSTSFSGVFRGSLIHQQVFLECLEGLEAPLIHQQASLECLKTPLIHQQAFLECLECLKAPLIHQQASLECLKAPLICQQVSLIIYKGEICFVSFIEIIAWATYLGN
jgi:hypothetical protein